MSRLNNLNVKPNKQQINVSSLTLSDFCVCSPDINECESQPCLNGGECVDRVANFTCVCPPTFTGALCETGDLINLNSARRSVFWNNGFWEHVYIACSLFCSCNIMIFQLGRAQRECVCFKCAGILVQRSVASPVFWCCTKFCATKTHFYHTLPHLLFSQQLLPKMLPAVFDRVTKKKKTDLKYRDKSQILISVMADTVVLCLWIDRPFVQL